MNELDLLTEALNRTDPAERAAFLDQACAGNPELRRRLEELLAAYSHGANPLDRPLVAPAGSPATANLPTPIATGGYRPEGATGTFAPSDPDAITAPEPVSSAPRAAGVPTGEGIGTVIAGRYTLVEAIGEGGMGSVYLANQTHPVRRQVALKLIKTGMDSRAVLARFEAERQALALMDHPHIARVYDGGTSEAGQPFFVMELVRGEPITGYCDRQRLTVQSRLELFAAVCQAVQHAHQKGIIHRDLKPGNVLVTEVDGRPTLKIIDFGIAKATEFQLTDQSFADTGAIVGTPAYMSPEQADPSSMDIDTRTDIYALGVILYELLTGSPPLDAGQFKRGAILEMLRMVREVDPPRPSTKVSAAEDLPNIAASRDVDPAYLKRALRGDLDWIVMKALEKDRTRRYETANGFAADILRHLAHEPVVAAPPSRAYRVRKFVRKHRGAVIAASLVLMALLAGIAGTTWGLIRADRALVAEAKRVNERDQALEKEAQRVYERDVAIKTANDRADDLKHRLGVSDMVAAQTAYDNRDVVLAAERLDNVPPEQRGWEWHYLKRQTRGGLFTLYGHLGAVSGVSFSPDGTRIATGSDDGTVKVWDARTGAPLLDLKDPTSGRSETKRLAWSDPGRVPDSIDTTTGILSVSFSPDGTRIVAGTTDNSRVWDARTGTLLLDLKVYTTRPISNRDWRYVYSASFSPDGTRIVTGSFDGRSGHAKVWDARTGTPLVERKGQMGAVSSASFSPDGARMVTDGGGVAAQVWDARTGAPLLEFKGPRTAVQPHCVSFSPDGKRIATSTNLMFMNGAIVQLWDARTGAPLHEFKGHAAAVTSMAFSPDGARIVTGGRDNLAKVWDARTGTLLLDLKGHTGWVGSVSFSPDGLWIVTGSDDHTAKLWDARTGTPLLELERKTDALYIENKLPTPSVWNVSFSPDGTRIISGTNGSSADKQTVWDARTGTPLLELEGNTGLFSPDGARIATGSGFGTAVKVWDGQTGTKLFESAKGERWEKVKGLSFSPDGTRILIVRDGGAEVLDARTGTSLLELMQRTEQLWSGSFSPDGTRIAIGGGRTVTVCDARTGTKQLEFKGHKSTVVSVSFDSDGARIVSCSQLTATVWDARTGAPNFELKGHTAEVSGASFSPDGRRIITGGGDQSVKVWDARTGALLLGLRGRTGRFSPDGTRIVTGGENNTVTVWDAPTESTVIELKGRTDRLAMGGVSFSPDGTRIGTACLDGTVEVWDARTGTPLLELKHFENTAFRVWFSPDGTRVVSRGNQSQLWDARTGQEVKGEPIPPATGPGRISPDGRRIAHVAGNRVALIPLQPDAEELEYRRIRTRPNFWRYRHGHEAARKAEDPFAARFYLDRPSLPARTPLEALDMGEWELTAGRTQNAVGHLATASAASPSDTGLSLEVGALQAWFGQDKEFADTCTRALDFAKGTSDPFTADRMAKVCCLRPSQDKARLESSLGLARKAVELGRANRDFNPFFELVLGMAEYRSGHLAEADAALIITAERVPMNPEVLACTKAFYRAMTLFRRGKESEARKLATEAASKMKPLPRDEKNPLADNANADDLILWMAYKEARAMISFEPPPAPPTRPTGK